MPRLVRDRLTWLTYAQLSAWAYFLYGFGPVVPLLRQEQGTSRTVAGLHGTAFAVGGIVAATITPLLVRRLGRHRVVWLGLTGVSIAALALLVARPLPVTLAIAMLASLSGSFVVNGVVAGLTDHHGAAGPASISEANAAAAAVGLVAPLVVGAAVSLGLGWRPGIAIVVIPVVFLAFFSGLRLPEPDIAGALDGHRAKRLPTTYWLAFASLFATSGVEFCLTLWSADVLRAHANVGAAVATAAVSTLIGGMFVGRLVGGRLVLRYRPTHVLLGALATSALGFAVFWSASRPWLALGGLVVCGFGVSLHYPLGIGLAVGHSGGQPDLAAARATYAIGTAFAAAPFALGVLADRVGPHLAFLLVPALLLVSAAAVTRLAMLSGSPQVGELDAQLAEQPT